MQPCFLQVTSKENDDGSDSGNSDSDSGMHDNSSEDADKTLTQ